MYLILLRQRLCDVIDLIDDDIHPPNKQDVGARLASIALKRDYGRDEFVASSPALALRTNCSAIPSVPLAPSSSVNC